MSQFMLSKNLDYFHLKYALETYHAKFFLIRPFSLGNRKEIILKNIENQTLSVSNKNGLNFFINNELQMNFPLKDYNKGFSIEYRDEKNMRLPHYSNPNENFLKQNTKNTSFRNVLDNLLIEIDFKGYIPLEKNEILENTIFWKLKQ